MEKSVKNQWKMDGEIGQNWMENWNWIDEVEVNGACCIVCHQSSDPPEMKWRKQVTYHWPFDWPTGHLRVTYGWSTWMRWRWFSPNFSPISTNYKSRRQIISTVDLRLTYGWPTGDLWVEQLDEVEVIGVNKGRRKSTCKSYCSAARWQLLHFLLHFFEFLCEFPCEFVSISLGGFGCVGFGLCRWGFALLLFSLVEIGEKLGRNWGEIGVKCIKNCSKWIEKCNLNACQKNVNTIGWN